MKRGAQRSGTQPSVRGESRKLVFLLDSGRGASEPFRGICHLPQAGGSPLGKLPGHVDSELLRGIVLNVSKAPDASPFLLHSNLCCDQLPWVAELIA